MPSGRSVIAALKALAPHRRMGLITIDQIISGGSNLLIILLVAHALSPQGFGWFTIIFLVYSLATTVQRALVSGPVLVHPEDADDDPGEVVGSALAVALLMSVLCAAAAVALWALGAERALSLLILAALLPPLLVQDLGRYLSWAVGKPVRSVWLDLLWLVLLLAGFAALALGLLPASLPVCLLLWGGSGGVAGLLVLGHGYGIRPGNISLTWLRRRWDFSWKYLLGAASAQLSVLGAVTVIVAFSTAATVAAVRAVTLLIRPGYTVQVAVGQSMTTDIARENPGPRGVWAHVLRAIAITSVVAVANVAFLLLMPDPVGRAILGNTWPLAEPLILPAGLQLLLAVLGSGTRDAMLGRRQITLVTVIDVAASLLLIAAAGIGAVVADARGVLWAMVIAQAALTVLWWVVFLTRARQPAAEEERVGSSPPP